MTLKIPPFCQDFRSGESRGLVKKPLKTARRMDFSPNALYQFKRYRPRFRSPISSLAPRRFESLPLNREDQDRKLKSCNPEFASSIPIAPANQSGAWRLYPQWSQQCPPMAGFCELAIRLRAPKLAAAGAKSPIVSGGYLKYSRFRETAAGDRVRSALRRRTRQCI